MCMQFGVKIEMNLSRLRMQTVGSALSYAAHAYSDEKSSIALQKQHWMPERNMSLVSGSLQIGALV